ncbi:hypothetical protein Tco_1134702 [Tanacetum coccineum]
MERRRVSLTRDRVDQDEEENDGGERMERTLRSVVYLSEEIVLAFESGGRGVLLNSGREIKEAETRGRELRKEEEREGGGSEEGGERRRDGREKKEREDEESERELGRMRERVSTERVARRSDALRLEIPGEVYGFSAREDELTVSRTKTNFSLREGGDRNEIGVKKDFEEEEMVVRDGHMIEFTLLRGEVRRDRDEIDLDDEICGDELRLRGPEKSVEDIGIEEKDRIDDRERGSPRADMRGEREKREKGRERERERGRDGERENERNGKREEGREGKREEGREGGMEEGEGRGEG